jgi:hypothetical protein
MATGRIIQLLAKINKMIIRNLILISVLFAVCASQIDLFADEGQRVIINPKDGKRVPLLEWKNAVTDNSKTASYLIKIES